MAKFQEHSPDLVAKERKPILNLETAVVGIMIEAQDKFGKWWDKQGE